MSRLFAALVTAITFLTRVPLPAPAVDDRTLGRAVLFFPVVGCMLGACVTGLAGLCDPHFSPVATAFLVAVLLAASTAGLHLDGLADLFDGLSGGKGDRARTLAIMRDGRIGAHGATALCLVLIGKVILTAEVIAAGEVGALWIVPAAARWAVVGEIAFFPYARSEGTGRAMAAHAGVGTFLVATIFLAGALLVFGLGLWPAAAGAFATAMLLALWLSRRLGGLTGDVYGAAIELGELTALAALAWGMDPI
jgi:adenosylcobinamide-GDP ribazoletransferase